MREQIINMLLTAIKESLGEEYLVDSSIIKKITTLRNMLYPFAKETNK